MALSRVKVIHGDCKLLLRTKQQTAGYVCLLCNISPISTRIDITVYQHGKCFIFLL